MELRAENERMRAALEWVRDDTELWDAPIVLDALHPADDVRRHQQQAKGHHADRDTDEQPPAGLV
jgi:hypothetical protein